MIGIKELMIYVVNFKEKIPKNGSVVINTTSSSSDDFGKQFSPFFLGPVKLYKNYHALKHENAWQFSKVYKEHVDQDNNPCNKYWEWAEKGWSDNWAHRFPMGKGAKPLYSFWDGEKLDYISARKKIYIPLYSQLITKTKAFEKLVEIKESMDKIGADLYLTDYDAYNHRKLNWTWDQVINCESKKMGHAFVLAMLLDGKGI